MRFLWSLSILTCGHLCTALKFPDYEPFELEPAVRMAEELPYGSLRPGVDPLDWRERKIIFEPSSYILDAKPGEEVIHMSGAGNSEYACLLPKPSPIDDEMAASLTRVAPEDNVFDIQARISKSLEHLATKCLYTTLGHWTYEFCHQRTIKQYHISESELSTLIGGSKPPREGRYFLLGRFLPGAENAISIVPGPFYVNRYKEGGICDVLNSHERTAEVRFECSDKRGGDHIIDVKEISLCKYVITIGTPTLCKDSLFDPSLRRPSIEVHCRLISAGNTGQLPTSIVHSHKLGGNETSHSLERGFWSTRLREILTDQDTHYPHIRRAVFSIIEDDNLQIMVGRNVNPALLDKWMALLNSTEKTEEKTRQADSEASAKKTDARSTDGKTEL